jgi:imidazolonepropionase-like amidohydrolase
MGRVCAVVSLSSLAVAGVLGWSLRAAAPAPAPASPARTLALVGGLIRTQTDAGDFVGTVVITDGKIVALGRSVTIPPDARRIDVAGHVITPGLIDAHGSLGLNSAAAREGGRDAGLNILDAVDPFAEDWRDAAAQGVTAVYVQPAGSGLLGGSGAVLRVGPGDTAEGLAIKAPAGVQAALGAAPPARPATDELPVMTGRRGGFPGIAPPAAQTPPAGTGNSLTRYSQYEQLRGQIDAAKRYGASRPTRRDPTRELLLRVVKGELPLCLEVTHEDDLRNALKLTGEFKLRTVLARLDRVPVLPDELSANRVSLVLGPFYTTTKRRAEVTPDPSTARGGRGGRGGRANAPARRVVVAETHAEEPQHSDELLRLALDGRRWAIGTFGDDPRASLDLRLHAAAAVAEGFPREQVLRALTRGAAELLGVADRLGALAVGRVADLAVFAGDPLDPSVPVRRVMSQGTLVHERPTSEAVPSLTAAAPPSLPERLPPSYVLKSSRVLNTAGELVPGEFAVENGRVTVRGDSSRAVPTFDLGDAIVTPGLIAAHHPLESGDTVDADAGDLCAADLLAPGDPTLRVFRDQGFLTVVVAPGARNVLAGRACAVRVSDAALPVIGEVGPQFVLTASARDTERFPASLAGQVEFVDGRLRSEEPKTSLYLPPAVRSRLLALRARSLDAARDRKQVALFEAQTRAEVRAALRLTTDHKLRGVLVGPRNLDELADTIRQARVGIVAAPARVQDPERLRRELTDLVRSGVPLAFGSGNATELRATAALLVQHGLPRPVARRGLTAGATALLGLPPSVGRLAPGDPADFVVWDGCPLDLGSRPLAVVANGQRTRRGL